MNIFTGYWDGYCTSQKECLYARLPLRLFLGVVCTSTLHHGIGHLYSHVVASYQLRSSGSPCLAASRSVSSQLAVEHVSYAQLNTNAFKIAELANSGLSSTQL